MDKQITIFTENTRYDELRDSFVQFHRAHPEVWKLFVRFTFDRINRGFQHYGAMGIIQRIRWETDRPEYEAGKEFKINNNHVPFYARLFMHRYPEHDGFFRTRNQASKGMEATHLPELTPAHFDS